MSALSSRTERLPRTSPEPSRHFLNRCGAALDPLANVAAAHCSATRLERVGTPSGPIAAAAQRLASRCRSAWPGWKRRGGRRDMLARRAVGAMSRAVRPRRAPSSSLFGSMLWFSFRGSAARAPPPSCPALRPPAQCAPCPPSMAPGIARALPPRVAAHFLPPTSPEATCTSQAAPALAPHGPTCRRLRALGARGQWVAPRRGGAVRGARRHRGRASAADFLTPPAGSEIGNASAWRARGGSVARSL